MSKKGKHYINVSESQKSIWQRPGYREKMSDAHRGQRLGIPRTDDVKKKVSESLKERYKDITKTSGWKGGISKAHGYKRRKKFEYEGRLKSCEGSHTVKEWELLKNKYKNTCPSCKCKEPDIILTQDHIIPLSLGGSDWIENIQPLCGSCNSHKSTNTTFYSTPANVDTN